MQPYLLHSEAQGNCFRLGKYHRAALCLKAPRLLTPKITFVTVLPVSNVVFDIAHYLLPVVLARKQFPLCKLFAI